MNEIILLVIGLAIGSALGYFIGVSKKLKSSDLSQQSGLASQISEMKGEIKGIFTEIEKSRDRSEDRRDAKLQDMSNTIDSFNRTISGTKTRGMVGESILKETLKNSIKVGVVKTELKIGSKNVEFAWDLGDGKYIPIDSKLPDVVSLVNKYELSKDTEEQKLLSKKIKDKVVKEISNIQKYQNQANTIDNCILVVPPSVLDMSPELIGVGKSNNVFVYPSDFGWSDLGTWGSLSDHISLDKKDNTLVSKKVLLYDSENNIVKMPREKVAVIQGLDGYIIVDTKQALLICKKEEEQKIKQFVADVKFNLGDEFV